MNLVEKNNKTELLEQQVSQLLSSFKSNHITTILRKRGLMVSKHGTVKSIKEILARVCLNLINNIQYVVKDIANKTIVTEEMVRTAGKMLN